MSDTITVASPVTTSGIPIRNLWHMLLYVWEAMHLQNHWKSEVEEAPSLDALLASILAHLVEQRLRIGLGRNYQRHSAEITGLKGRVCFPESLKRLSFPHGRAYCQFQEFTADVPMNQIVRSTLLRLVQLGNLKTVPGKSKLLCGRLRQLVRDMETVQLVELTERRIRREQAGRHDRDYSIMLSICLLLYQRQMPVEAAGLQSLPVLDRDELLLHRIYEKFVARFYARHLSDWKTLTQCSLKWPADEECSYLPRMCPDLTLVHRKTGWQIVLDTKFTPYCLVEGKGGKPIFQPGHLYQLYAYLRSQEQQSPSHRTSTGLLLYPTVKHHISESTAIQGHLVSWQTIDLAQEWTRIEDDLLAIPARILAATQTSPAN